MRKTTLIIIVGLITSFGIGFCINSFFGKQDETNFKQSNINSNNTIKNNMKLGAFSISLSVKDINTSKAFYENLGFTAFAGDIKQNYLIMKNENTLIGLFQGMFEGNILTFNPGWDENAKNLEKFNDVREIQRHLKDIGININPEADENTTGPASFMVTDPDGNVLLFDQHR